MRVLLLLTLLRMYADDSCTGYGGAAVLVAAIRSAHDRISKEHPLAQLAWLRLAHASGVEHAKAAAARKVDHWAAQAVLRFAHGAVNGGAQVAEVIVYDWCLQRLHAAAQATVRGPAIMEASSLDVRCMMATFDDRVAKPGKGRA